MISIQYHKPKVYWISINLILIFLMVSIGGITRLTDSGLSMTEWSLIGGIIPPLTTHDWIETFDKYKLSPEFTFKNYDMTIEEFKKIFFWEYFHRIWGRLIGLTYTLPLIYFWLTNKFTSSEKVFFSILLFFGASQAFMGWYMVKSGLTENPDVSHFRLSAHLFIAFLIYSMLLFYLSLKITLKKNIYISKNKESINFSNILIYTCVILIFVTIVSGAFVAGTKAGWAYNNFPLMGETILPPVLLETQSNSVEFLFNDIGFIQFFHRILATATLLIILFTSIYLFRVTTNKVVKRLSKILSFVVILQYILGIIILKLYVPITLGVMHQLGSLIILSLLITILAKNLSLGILSNSQRYIID